MQYNNFFKNKILILAIIIAFIGGFIGAVSSPYIASANIFDNIMHFLGINNLNSTSSTSTDTNLNKPQPVYNPTVDYEQAVINAVKEAEPSVVSIVISKYVPVIEQCPYNPFSGLPPEFQQFFGDTQFYAPCQKGTKLQEVGGGSGFIVSSDGIIITNKHVVSDTKADYTVLMNDGKKYKATILARDPVQDLAVLKINATGLKAIKLGDSDSLQLGQTAIAIGNALGEFRNTVSVGVVSGLARKIQASGLNFGSEELDNVIQTDAAINPGNSGGPLLNLKGEVIGINTAIVSGAQNIGFAIPINQAKRDIQSVLKTGTIQTPYLGVRYLTVDSDIAKSQKLPVDYGALLRGNENGPAVEPNSPADKAGLKAEDIILEVNGQKVDANHSLISIIQKYNVGDTITLKVQRGDQILNINIILGQRPKNI
ncbi:MAG: S1C family serine protease [Minisyncoccia bacterium]